MGTERGTQRLQVGLRLIGACLAIAAAGIVVALVADGVVVRVLVVAISGAIIVALWGLAVQNGRAVRRARRRLRADHPGALVERVRLAALPKGPVLHDIPPHFLVAEAREITFETVDQTVLVRIPVEELASVDLAPVRRPDGDHAVTLVYGDGGHVVQFVPAGRGGTGPLRDRVRAAVGWSADTTP